ncbi:hypothetical protein D3C76_939150 [compost metagenome]
MGVGREALAAVLPGDDQGKETVLLDVLPSSGGQIHVLADLPIVDHGAECFGGAIEEGLLFFGQLCRRVGQQGVPVRATAEQFAIPPDRAGIYCFALRIGHGRQGALEPGEQRCAKVFAAQVGQGQGQGCGQ